MDRAASGSEDKDLLDAVADRIVEAREVLWRDRPRYQSLPIAPYTHDGMPGFMVLGPDKFAFVPADGGPFVLLDAPREEPSQEAPRIEINK
jgi:hypothetical protein